MAMKKREHTLQHTKLAQRAFSLPCADRRAISYYIQLRYGHLSIQLEYLLSGLSVGITVAMATTATTTTKLRYRGLFNIRGGWT